MEFLENYLGCQIFINDGKGTDIAKTTIIEHNEANMTVTVAQAIQSPKNEVTVLVLTARGVYEYRGKLAKSTVNPMNTVISLYKGIKKENRAAMRYTVNTMAEVANVTLNSKVVDFAKPLYVLIVNLSSAGALIRANRDCFKPKETIELKVVVGNAETTIYAKILRINSIDDHVSEYGCKFVFSN